MSKCPILTSYLLFNKIYALFFCSMSATKLIQWMVNGSPFVSRDSAVALQLVDDQAQFDELLKRNVLRRNGRSNTFRLNPHNPDVAVVISARKQRSSVGELLPIDDVGVPVRLLPSANRRAKKRESNFKRRQALVRRFLLHSRNSKTVNAVHSYLCERIMHESLPNYRAVEAMLHTDDNCFRLRDGTWTVLSNLDEDCYFDFAGCPVEARVSFTKEKRVRFLLNERARVKKSDRFKRVQSNAEDFLQSHNNGRATFEEIRESLNLPPKAGSFLFAALSQSKHCIWDRNADVWHFAADAVVSD